jgi:hypothetical protein
MNRRLPVVLALSLVVFAVAPAAATPGAGAGPADQADDCTNGNRGPSGDAGPPGFVADAVPTFLGDLFADLPVPGFVTSAVGADPSC